MEVHEPRVEILDLRTMKVVAVVEVVSPSNKARRAGPALVPAKTAGSPCGQIHLIEIDLLRSGRHVLRIPRWCVQESAALRLSGMR